MWTMKEEEEEESLIEERWLKIAFDRNAFYFKWFLF